MSAPQAELAVPDTGRHRVRGFVPRLMLHDGLAVIGALVILAAGWLAHRALTRPRMATFTQHGLALRYPAELGFRDPPVATPGLPAAIRLRKPGDARMMIEIKVDQRRPLLGSLAAALELGRASRYAPFYNRGETGTRTVNGKGWLRTQFTYVAEGAGGGGGEAVAVHAVEYAYPSDPSVNSANAYLVTVHGSAADAERLEQVVLSSLVVP